MTDSENTLAYFRKQLIVAVKIFMIQPRASTRLKGAGMLRTPYAFTNQVTKGDIVIYMLAEDVSNQLLVVIFYLFLC
jgi:hypothetical protein